MNDTSVGPRPARRRVARWEAIGAIAGVLGVLVTVLVACSGGPGRTPAQPVAPPAATNGVGIQQNGGQCQIAGGGDVSVSGDVNCVDAPPRSMAGIDVAYGSGLSALYAGTDRLPPAPDGFDGYGDGPFCHGWTGWVETAPDVYLVDPIVDVDIESGRDELMVVKDVRVVIFGKTPIPGGAAAPRVVNCQVGGGHNPGNVVRVDTTVPSTMLAAGSGEGPGDLLDPVPMPPASLTSEDIEHEGVTIAVTSEEGFYYTGRLEIVTRANGEEKVNYLGSRQQPFRWVSDRSSRYHPMSAPEFVSWNSNSREWVVGDDIYGV